jgi:hypothetical protein
MSNDLLNLDLRLLLARYGRRRVLDGLAQVSNARPEELDAELARLESRPRLPKRRSIKTADEIAAELQLNDPLLDQTVRELARRFDSGSFIPTLRDVNAFLREHKVGDGKLRSRREAAAAVVNLLSSLEIKALKDLISDLDRNTGKSEYYHLAHQIMGRPSKSG